MSTYIHFTPESKNLSAPASGKSGVLGFVRNQEVIAATVSADTMADWITLDTQHLPQCSFNYTVAPNTEGERTAVISIAAKVQVEGSAEQIVDYDITTIRQSSQNSGTGSIIPQYTSFTPKAEGDSGVCTFTTSNIIPSTIGISCDSTYVDFGYLTDASSIKTGFTWSVPANNGETARQFTFTISARRTNGVDYAYAYVSGVQPSVNNVGWIKFEYDTVRASASTMSSSINFETEFVPRITSAITDDYWLHATFIDVQSGQTEGRYDGQLDFTIDDNPYNYARVGQITLYGTSDVDESLVQTTLHFYQALNPYGGTQTGFIHCSNQTIIMETPEAVSNPTICQFHLTYDNIDLTTVDVLDFTGNFAGAPTFPEPTKQSLVFALNNAPSTTDYTTSTIRVTAQDTNQRTIPPITLTVMQPPFVEYVEFPIWKDTDLTIPSETEYLYYQITINNDIVYAGRAYALNGNVTIRLNEIMQQVLLPDLNLEIEGLQDNNAYANAVMFISLDGGNTYQKYKQIKTYADWSYKPQTSNILSVPISYEIDRRQILLCSAMDYAGDGPTVVVTITDSEGETRDNVYSLYNKIGTVVQKVYDTDNVLISAGETDVEYLVIDSCKRYCLYYLNANGGWDSFLFNKTSKEQDDFERLTYTRNINNTTIKHRTVEYRNNLKKKWVLKTGYLNDKQSLIFAEHLAGSPCTYLHDLDEDIIYPVNITNKNVDYQTYTRNGRKLCKYELNVELSQERQRR